MLCACAALFITCDLPGCTLFFHISHKRQDLKKKVIKHEMFVLIFSAIFARNISHCKKNSVRCDHKRILVVMEVHDDQYAFVITSD